MTHLVVLGLDNREDAERVFDLTADLAQLEQGKAAEFVLARTATVEQGDRHAQAPRPDHPPDQPDQGPRDELVKALQS